MIFNQKTESQPSFSGNQLKWYVGFSLESSRTRKVDHQKVMLTNCNV